MVGLQPLRLASLALSHNSSPLALPEPKEAVLESSCSVSQNKHTRDRMAFSPGSPWNAVLKDWVLSG